MGNALTRIGAVLLGSGLFMPGCTGLESPGDKHEWSVLQAVEQETRAARADRAQLRTVEGHELAGLPRLDDGRVIWVMLKPMHGSLYKQMPEGNFWIDRPLLRQLEARGALSATVAQALRSHVRE